MKKRSKHTLSHHKLLTCDTGKLVPIACMNVLPGDSMQHATSALIRCSPLVAPVMHPVDVRIHHWFVPNRLIWEDWEDFITGGADGNNADTHPTINLASAAIGSLADYIGVPTGSSNTTAINALPFRAYAKIWNEFYRDQDLDTALTIDETSGADTTTNTTLQNISWEKDYFTSARGDTQKGTEVTLPLGTSADVAHGAADANDLSVYSTVNTDYHKMVASTANLTSSATSGASSNKLYADLSTATAASINDLREAFMNQKFMELRSRFGHRYTDLLAYYGIRAGDQRLQRPEYLGGGKQTLQFSEVLQTGVDSTDAGVGTMKGHGITAMGTNRYRKFFPEHGIVLSLMSVRPKSMYYQGINKHLNRTTKEDYWQMELQHVGQQAVKNQELYADHTTPGGTFGYQDRYDEYRRHESGVSGEFRDSTYNFWHMARTFSSDPALNSTFVKCSPTNRVFQDTSNHQLLVMAKHSIQARRLVSKVGSPRGI